MPRLRIAQRVDRTRVEGPGERFALWVQGCSIRCPGCCNPEMFPLDGGDEASIDALADAIASSDVEGLTLLGGEPFEQAAGCAALAERVRASGRSVMVFTGYLLEELRARRDPAVDALLAAIDLLVDGPFDRALAERTRRWIGSQNQTLHFLTDRYAPTDPRFHAPNELVITLDRRALAVHGFPSARVVGRRTKEPSA